MTTRADAWPPAPDDAVWVVFAIYCKPLDFENHWVVRRWFAMRGVGLVADVVPRIANTLAEARRHVPPEHTMNIWNEMDDPFLHEAWATADFVSP